MRRQAAAFFTGDPVGRPYNFSWVRLQPYNHLFPIGQGLVPCRIVVSLKAYPQDDKPLPYICHYPDASLTKDGPTLTLPARREGMSAEADPTRLRCDQTGRCGFIRNSPFRGLGGAARRLQLTMTGAGRVLANEVMRRNLIPRKRRG